MAQVDWIFPIGEGICVDEQGGRWSDGAFFEDQDVPTEWHQAEPAPHVQDRAVWKHWLAFLETSRSAGETLLTVAKSRARAKIAGVGTEDKNETPKSSKQPENTSVIKESIDADTRNADWLHGKKPAQKKRGKRGK